MISLRQIEQEGLMYRVTNILDTKEKVKQCREEFVERVRECYKLFADSQRKAKSKYFGVPVLD